MSTGYPTQPMCCEAKESRPPTPLESALQMTREKLASHETGLEELERRLGCVLRQGPVSNAGLTKTPPDQPRSSLVEEIYLVNARLDDMRLRVARIIDCLDI